MPSVAKATRGAAGLQTYRRKRRFDVTAEPRGSRKRAKGTAFVIQKHAASRLHYDLRLEHDGVMKSWAVTRGPSLVPGEKRLAVHVEDHPIEYNAFEGTIPKGEYGGGTVMIWDRGRWHPEGDVDAAFKKGHLAFRLEGKKLSGNWHLVRMRKRPGEHQESWLLIKSDDEAARSPRDKDILEDQPLSAASGRTMDQIATGKRVWHSNRRASTETKAAAPKAALKAFAKSAKAVTKKPAPRKKPAKKVGKTKKAEDQDPLPGAPAGNLPDFVPPELAALSSNPPRDPDWVHEVKFDGYRIEARLDHRKAKLLTRRGLDWTDRFPRIAQAVSALPARQALLDGEIVAEDKAGHASFSRLQQDLKEGRADRLVYYAFDLLHLDGRDLTGLSFIERKQALRALIAHLSKNAPVRVSEHFEEDGAVLLEHACRMSLEGIISKRKSAPYRSGRVGDWIKIKCSDRQEFVVAGYAPSTVDPRAIGALILGYYKDGKLTYAGRVGTGFTHKMAGDLWRQLQKLRVDKPPFDALPKEETRARNAQWVEPRMVIEADLRGWTHGDRVRQASFQGVREDKLPKEVVRELKAGPPRTKIAAAARRSPVKKIDRASKPYSVKLSHPERVYWEDAGVTKKRLADYYVEVWDHMRPHVANRVLALVRCPEGATGECFFQKHASSGMAQDKLRLVSEPDGDKAITIDDLDGLIALVQAGVLEVHVRGSSADDLERCDRLIFDLDPGPGVTWPDIKAAALEVRERLKTQGLVSFVKTTGGKGLHVVVPIRHIDWDVAKEFARRVAADLAKDDPSRYTATIAKRARTGRIFVDYLRNSREATAVAAFSTRARPGAPVSVPIAWEELKTLSAPNRYTVLNIGQRLAHLRRDPWAELGKVRQALPTRSRK